MCSDRGSDYHVEFNPPAETETYDECGGDLYHRADDQEEPARERLRVDKENT